MDEVGHRFRRLDRGVDLGMKDILLVDLIRSRPPAIHP